MANLVNIFETEESNIGNAGLPLGTTERGYFEELDYTNVENSPYRYSLELPGTLADDIKDRLMVEESMDEEFAKKSLENALIFLHGASEISGVKLSPSSSVDKAWHNFILFTEEYTEYCNNILGRFIHHRPHTKSTSMEGVLSPVASYKALEELGYQPDDLVWFNSADCDSGCDGGGGGGDFCTGCSGLCDGN